MHHPWYLYAVLLGAAASMAAEPYSAAPPGLAPSSAPLPAATAPETAPPAPLPESLTSFDPLSVELLWQEHRWRLMAGSQLLKDFGRREAEGRQALRLIRELHLTQQGTVGRPLPILEYWLSDGQAPCGSPTGVRLLTFDVPTLRVEQIQAQWCLRDQHRVLFNFGLRRVDAEEALAVVRKYEFSRLALVGQAIPSMYVFLRSPADQLTTAQGPARPHTLRDDDKPHPSSAPSSPYPAVGAIVTPAIPPLQGSHHPGPRQPLGREGVQLTSHRPGQPVSQGTELPGMDEQEECLPFDWRQVQIRQEEDGWKLMIGGTVLANLGPSEEDARLAFAAVRHYRFSEQYRVGRPRPSFSYYLCNGQPPHGVMFGLRSQAFEPETLSVEQIGYNWAICSGNQVLIQLGSRAEESRRLLEVIQRLKLDRLCCIGEPLQEGGMTFLAKSR
jgi:hypothetical protein